MPYLIDEIDIDLELREKRFNPKILIKGFETYFEDMSNTHRVSTREAISHWQKKRRFFKKEKELVDHFTDFAKIADKIAIDAHKFAEAASRGDDYSDKTLNSLTEKLERNNDKIKSHSFDKKTFSEINEEFWEFKYRNNITGSALDSLLSSSFIEILSSTIGLLVAVFIVLEIEEPLKEALLPIGKLNALIIVTLLIYLGIDRLVERFKEYLLWERVKFLSGKGASN